MSDMPNRAFFESDPRSTELRTVCLQSVEAYGALLLGDEVAVGALLDNIKHLRELGIEAGMHTVTAKGDEATREKQALKQNPVRLAEYVGGQILNFLDRSETLGPPDESALAEHDEINGEVPGVVVTEVASTGPQIVEFKKQLSFIGVVNTILDYGATDPSNPQV